MFSWLFGSNNPQKKSRQETRSGANAETAEPQNIPLPTKPDSQKFVDGMGGPEQVARVIKTMLAEDRIKKASKDASNNSN